MILYFSRSHLFNLPRIQDANGANTEMRVIIKVMLDPYFRLFPKIYGKYIYRNDFVKTRNERV